MSATTYSFLTEEFVIPSSGNFDIPIQHMGLYKSKFTI